MEWRNLPILAIAVPIGLFCLFLAGRVLGWGWAKSWFEAKRKYNKENDNEPV